MQSLSKKAFTLAEVMITLIVIGVITAIVMPIVANSTPDKNVMKFKKADTTLKRVIKELVNSDEYYANGDLGLKYDGITLAGKYDFCNTFADIASAKKVNCNYTTTNNGALSLCTQSGGVCEFSEDRFNNLKSKFDSRCLAAQQAYSGTDLGVVTTDNVSYYEENFNDTFGCVYGSTCFSTNHPGYEGNRLYNFKGLDILNDINGIKTNRFIRVVCIDIDGINKGEDPFGYGIRVDEKSEWCKSRSMA